MDFLWILGFALVGGGILLLYYLFLPEGIESAHPYKHIFGKERWKFWESDDERAERLTDEYTRIAGMYAAKNEALTQYHQQANLPAKIHSGDNALIAFFKNISASHDAASSRGRTLDTHSKIQFEQSKVKPELKKKRVEAKLDRKMYVYDRMHEAGREYYRLKASGASRREVQNQKQHWENLKREWENTSKN